jgi:DNA-binding NarL/FixJ family response regulator
VTRPLIRILVADPYPVIARGIRNLVETKDYYRVVGEAQNGRDALRLASELVPQIAIVAYSLPELNGIELAHEMKRINPEIGVLLYTMHDRDETLSEAIRAGIRGLVLKSEPESYLLAALDAISLNQPFYSGTMSDEMMDRHAKSHPASILSHREREIVQLIAEGRTNKEAAHLLGVNCKTVETHRSHALKKLNLRTVSDLVRYAFRNKIILG